LFECELKIRSLVNVNSPVNVKELPL